MNIKEIDEKYAKEIERIAEQHRDDPEIAHDECDTALENALNELGMTKTADAFYKASLEVGFWYA